MKNKIKEIADKCYGPNPGGDWDFNEMKFAELIVKECVQTLGKRYMGDNNREDMEVRRCIEDVKKHFGVK